MMKLFKNNNTVIMKIVIAINLLLFLLVSVGNANEWTLVWSDEFNYEGQPDSDKWQYERGFVRNEELAYFTDHLKNVRVEDGRLIIEAQKETIPNQAYVEGSTEWKEEREFADYTSASITTRSKKSFVYGRFEVRAKMPYGLGSHCGIWFSGANNGEVGWPACGEIDIMEYVGWQPHKVHIFNHYADPEDITQEEKTTVGRFVVMNPYNDFHIYAIEWDEAQIKYFIDNKQRAIFDLDWAGTGSDNPFRKEQVFHLTYSLGGWGGEVDDSTLPQKLEIDYVRVYYKEYIAPPSHSLLHQLPPIIHSGVNKKEQRSDLPK